jgi:alpha-L-arabinofuranosidase
MKRSEFVALLGLIVILLGSLGMPRKAIGLEIRVNAEDAVQKVSPELFGNSVIYYGNAMGFSLWVSDEGDYEEAKRGWNYYLPDIAELGPPVLRYPHGLGANNFHWKEGIGPIVERNPDYDGQGIPQTFGTDEFLQYCEELGSKAIFVVNVSVGGKRLGSVQDAADWVEYCNAPNDGSNPGGGIDWAARRAANGHKEPYGVKYWELGNEETYPGWEDYAGRVQAYSAAMKAIDPTIQTGVIRTGTGLDAVYRRNAWLEYHAFMLERAGDSFDFWIHHTHAPSSSGLVNGFEMLREGVSVSADFSVDQEGRYSVGVPVEARCSFWGCPTLELWIDGEKRGSWSAEKVLEELVTPLFSLTPGQHRLRLQAVEIPGNTSLTVCQQLRLMKEGEEDPVWVDLKNGLELYHACLGGVPVAEEVLAAGNPHTGGKPVFYTEANSQYQDNKRPPYISKACAVREMLSVSSLYHAFLRYGVPLANYWLLFQEHDGLGVLEGVAYDAEVKESGRLDPRRRPVFHLLKAYRWNALDWVVSTETRDSPSFLVGRQTGLVIGYARKDFEVPYVQAVSTVSEKGDKLSLFVINLHPDEDMDAYISLEGFQPKAQCKTLTITGPSFGANNEPEDCQSGQCVNTREDTKNFQGSGLAYRFPRHSVTALLFTRVGSDQQSPVNPAGLAGTAGDGRVQLVWDMNIEEDLDGYFVYRSRSPEGPFHYRVYSAPIDGNEYLDTTVDNEATYTYAVTAVDLAGNESGFSNKISLTPGSGNGGPDDPPVTGGDQTPPSPPILLKAR